MVGEFQADAAADRVVRSVVNEVLRPEHSAETVATGYRPGSQRPNANAIATSSMILPGSCTAGSPPWGDGLRRRPIETGDLRTLVNNTPPGREAVPRLPSPTLGQVR